MNRGKFVWVPAFLVGLATVTAAELAAGLLLYSGLGFLRALTAVLAVQMGAFALGLWTAWGPDGRPGIEQVRRWWLFCLIMFTVAATFAGVTRILGSQPANGLGQGLGLALMGGLPMLAAGGLLGAMGRLVGQGTRGGVTVGAGAASGAALGFVLTGFVFVPRLEPSSTLLICVILLSLGALLHGWVLDQREVAEQLELRWTARGLVRVEDRARGVPRTRRRVIVEADRIRGSESVEGGDVDGWESAIRATLARGQPPIQSVLVYGNAAGTLARGIRADAVGGRAVSRVGAGSVPETGVPEDAGLEKDPLPRLMAVEPNPDVRRLAMAHFPPGRKLDEDPWAGIQLRDGLHLADLASLTERFDLVVVDAAALGRADGMPPVAPGVLRPLLTCLEDGGTLIVGGLESPPADDSPGLDAWMAAAHVLSADRRALVVGDEMFLVMAARVDGTDWAGGNTKEWGRWVTDMAAPASEPEGRPLDAAQETGSSSRASEARLEPEAPTDTPGTATDPANAP